MHDYLPALRAVFFSVFDDLQGLKLLYEVPEGACSLPLDEGASLFDLASEYILPKEGICGHLITICLKRHKILGYPVFLSGDGYGRGMFVFNVSFVFDRDSELAAYEPLVRKTGRTLKALEESAFLLSSTEKRVRMHSVIEQLYEDLNSYSETCISLMGVHALDLRLFPIFPNPPAVNDWDVPLLLVSLADMQDDSWDLTLVRLIKHIDGVTSAKMAAKKANVDLALAKECFQHLLYYSCIMLLDLFQYSNSYALVGGPASLGITCAELDEDGADAGLECASYVAASNKTFSTLTLLKLYAKLQPGLSVSDWIDQNEVDETAIDVRRMMSFGVIKGFIKRCYCYPIWIDHPDFKDQGRSRGRSNGMQELVRHQQANWPAEIPLSLSALLDGKHHTDELCVKYKTGFSGLVKLLKMIGDIGPDDETPNGLDLGKVKLLYV